MRQIFANAGMTMTREDDEVHASCVVASRRHEIEPAAAMPPAAIEQRAYA